MIRHQNKHLASRLGESILEPPISLQNGLQQTRGIIHRNFSHTGQDQSLVLTRTGVCHGLQKVVSQTFRQIASSR